LARLSYFERIVFAPYSRPTQIAERFFRGAFNLYHLRLNSGQTLHALTEHTQIWPVGARIRARISAEHPLGVFPLEKV
jgi:hypothetical protein